MIKFKWSFLGWGRAWLPVLACLVLVTGCPVAPPPECVTDADCEEGEVCTNGVCVSAPECETDADCDEGEVCENGVCVEAPPGPADTFPTSFHGQRQATAYHYSAANGGFESISQVPITDLGCQACHKSPLADGTEVEAADYAPSCEDCHADRNNPGPVADDICLGCHSRQAKERALLTDVHANAGMTCMACHTEREMHGDGTEYDSFLSEGAMDTRCENCHADGDDPDAPIVEPESHDIHQGKLHCSACHVQSVLTCYACHFETEAVAGIGKRWFGQAPRTGFKMLMNYDGQVRTATFQSLTFGGSSFVGVVPFVSHSITKEGIACGDCHRQGGAGNANIEEYVSDGQITVTAWDPEAEGADRLVGPEGVIPVVPDWETDLLFVFPVYTGEPDDAIDMEANLPLFDLMDPDEQGRNLLFGEPLTQEQMDDLSNF
ncbi:MAG: cytochrome c3 family protein [Phycisphaerae bacterium]